MNRRLLKWVSVAPLICASTLLSQGRTVLGGGPSLEALRPPIGSRGTEFSVIARGSSLSEVKEVITYREGMKFRTIEKVNDDEIKLTFSTKPDSPLGIRWWFVGVKNHHLDSISNGGRDFDRIGAIGSDEFNVGWKS